MQLENMTDEQIIQRLLEADNLPEKTVSLPRLGIPVTLKGLTGKQVSNIRERCTERSEKRGKISERLDEEQFNAALIAAATVKPNLADPKLLSKYNASGPEEVVRRILLAGELAAVGDVVLDISGFNVDLEELKNV
ncbi:XkdN [Desulforamulus aquiferis]|nr:XkdN [Desulforamulus aquiferis]